MLFDTYSTQAAQASLDSLWMQTKVISNNLANADTPGYKSQHVSFEQALEKASASQYAKGQRMSDSRRASSAQNGATVENEQMSVSRDASSAQNGSMGNTSLVRSGANLAKFRSTVMTDENTSVRIDGNNVSLEREQTELWKTYAQYSYLIDRVSGHYSQISTAINNMRNT